MAGCVHLLDVQVGAGGDPLAGLALAAGLARLGSLAVDRHRHQPGNGGLADAANAAKQVGMRQIAANQGILQCAHDHILADQITELLGPPATRQYHV